MHSPNRLGFGAYPAPDFDEIDGLELPCSSFPGTDLAPSSYLSVQSEPGSASPSSIVPVPSPDPQVVGIESSVSHLLRAPTGNRSEPPPLVAVPLPLMPLLQLMGLVLWLGDEIVCLARHKLDCCI